MAQHDGSGFGGAGSGAPGTPGGSGEGPARIVQLVAGELLLTVNPVDGSEIEPCPPGMRPEAPTRRPAAERPAAYSHGAAERPQLPLLERTEERSRIAGLLACGRSVRVTAPLGGGRSALLDAVVPEVAGLAPDGVVRLDGSQHTAQELEYALYAAVFDAFGHRPEPAELHAALRGVGAVVLVDDLGFGGEALESLLSHTPECAFLFAALPETPAPQPASHVEEVALGGLSRTGALELLEHALRRPLTDAEADWAAGLWMVSQGSPLAFVQAAALLRLGGGRQPADGPPVRQLVPALPEAAREVLRYALALEDEVPHRAHLPALTGADDADDALPLLLGAGLVAPVGARFRLAPGVAEQLTEAGYAEGSGARALTAARHYGWWAGHPSVTAVSVGAEAEALLAALKGAQRDGAPSAAVLLARAAAPVLAAGVRWSDWERILRGGQEAARVAGEVAEEAYFHHELGVLALCSGRPERAQAALEASIGLRGVLADQRGTVAGRRALALVADRLRAREAAAAAGEPSPAVPAEEAGLVEESELPSTAPGSAPQSSGAPPTLASAAAVGAVTSATAAAKSSSKAPTSSGSVGSASEPAGQGDEAGGSGLSLRGSRRNLVAAGAGALLVAVLGTVVTLNSTAGDGDPDTVRPQQSASRTEQPESNPEAGESVAPGGPKGSSRSARPVDSGASGGSSRGSGSGSGSEETSGTASSSASSPGKPPRSTSEGSGDAPSSPKDPPSSSSDDAPSSPEEPPSSPEDPPSETDEPTPTESDDDGQETSEPSDESGQTAARGAESSSAGEETPA